MTGDYSTSRIRIGDENIHRRGDGYVHSFMGLREDGDTIAEASGEEGTDIDDKKAKHRQANRKKHERQKAKKKQQSELLGLDSCAHCSVSEASAERACPVSEACAGRARRLDTNGARGKGMFAVELINESEIIAAAVPALSVVFDACSTRVCAFCFSKMPLNEVQEMIVTLRTGENGSGYGMVRSPPYLLRRNVARA